MKIKLLGICLVFLILAATSCNDDESNVVIPTYSDITITPEQAVYHVGDVIKCSITQKSDGSSDLLETSYWWYASWWYGSPNQTADFQNFTNGTCASSEIVLTKSGEVKLYFFGQLKYPEWNWIKVEIPRIITVEE